MWQELKISATLIQLIYLIVFKLNNSYTQVQFNSGIANFSKNGIGFDKFGIEVCYKKSKSTN